MATLTCAGLVNWQTITARRVGKPGSRPSPSPSLAMMPGPVVHRRGGHHISFPPGQGSVRDQRSANRADRAGTHLRTGRIQCQRADLSVTGQPPIEGHGVDRANGVSRDNVDCSVQLAGLR